MKPLTHFLLTALLAASLYLFYSWWALFAFITGFLVDLDHYIFYFFQLDKKTEDYKAVKGFFRGLFEKQKQIYAFYNGILKTKQIIHVQGKLFIFHNIELLLVFATLAFFLKSKIFLILTIGLLAHYVSDIAYELKTIGRLVRAPSVIFYSLKKIPKEI